MVLLIYNMYSKDLNFPHFLLNAAWNASKCFKMFLTIFLKYCIAVGESSAFKITGTDATFTMSVLLYKIVAYFTFDTAEQSLIAQLICSSPFQSFFYLLACINHVFHILTSTKTFGNYLEKCFFVITQSWHIQLHE